MNTINTKQKVSGLWVGEELPLLAQLCIKSYLDHGINFQLFTYKSFDNIPTGTTERDARDILPEESVFYHENGSLAPFADWFRNEFLVREGGYWTDLDVACLSDSLPEGDVWFCAQEAALVAVGVIAFPPRHPLMENLRASAEDPAFVLPWDSPEEILAKKNLAKQMPDVAQRRRKAPWGHCGPEGFTRALKHFKLLSAAATPSRLYPLHYTVWRKCYNGDCHLDSPELRNAWAIHLWGEMLRHEPDAWENVSRSSIVGQLLDKHLPGHAREPYLPERRKVKILVGICSCNNAAKRRVACRETWLSHQADGIECRFFLGRREPLAEEADVINLWVDDGYSHLPAKGLAFYKWALANYDFDWLFKCDDDTYLVLERLESLCSPDADLIGDMSVAARGFPSGGAGYLMKRTLVESIVAAGTQVPETGAEDVIFGELARKLSARLSATSRLNLHHSPSPWIGNEQVSCHWCSPEKLHSIEDFYKSVPCVVMHGKHSHWEDELYFFRNGRFRRKTSGCTGDFYMHGAYSLKLHWDTWPVEALKRDDNGFHSAALSITPIPGQAPFSTLFEPAPPIQ